MEAYSALCDSAQRALLYSYHDTLLALILADLPDNRKSFGNVCHQFPELSFIGDIGSNDNRLSYTGIDWALDRWDLNTRVIWRTELPGGRTSEHMVAADRMILGDYIIDEHSDTINWWAVLITLAVALSAIILISRRRQL